MPNFDAIIIGTGQAGPSLARRLAQSGRKVAVIERHLFGGTCVNTGCIPTKAMVASAYAVHTARRGADYGFDAGKVTVDMKAVSARKEAISAASREGLEKSLDSLENCTVIRGHARFTGPRQVRAGDQALTADQIFINVGGRAARPPIAGIDAVAYLTNSSMMHVDFLPRHLVIVGGSYIGLEFGQMFRRFGSEVTIVEKGPRLIAREDEDTSRTALEILEAEGISVRLNAECIRVEPDGDGVRIFADCAAGSEAISGSQLLLAIGRTPNTADLDLELAGVETDTHGYIRVNDRLETSAPGIWALGDCNGKGAFTHTSYNDYEIVAGNLLDGDSRRVSDRIQAYGLYIDPPLGRAGMTEAEARRSGRPLLIGKRPMTRVGRAVEKGETHGFMKVVVDRESKKILGACIFGTGGDEAIHSILDAMYAGAPYTVVQRAVHIHPTVSELIPTVLGELQPA